MYYPAPSKADVERALQNGENLELPRSRQGEPLLLRPLLFIEKKPQGSPVLCICFGLRVFEKPSQDHYKVLEWNEEERERSPLANNLAMKELKPGDPELAAFMKLVALDLRGKKVKPSP